MNSDNHNYDGIDELDNPLPNWWLATFLGTIIFAVIYLIHYTTGGPSQSEELAEQMAAMPQVTEKIWSDEELKLPFSSPENIASGKAVYVAKCAACHGAEGQGLIGPNLSDKFWIHGAGLRKDTIEVIQKGVVANGMPAWGGVLADSEMINVSAFVYSLRQTNPKNPKPPQGKETVN